MTAAPATPTSPATSQLISSPSSEAYSSATTASANEQFHEGSKKAGFMGMLKLLLKCESAANDAGDIAGAVS